jgi:hypothetical protein
MSNAGTPLFLSHFCPVKKPLGARINKLALAYNCFQKREKISNIDVYRHVLEPNTPANMQFVAKYVRLFVNLRKHIDFFPHCNCSKYFCFCLMGWRKSSTIQNDAAHEKPYHRLRPNPISDPKIPFCQIIQGT